MALYLEQGEISPDQLHAPFEKALRERHLIPVCFVSARNDAGVAELLDIFAGTRAQPTEGNPPPFLQAAKARDAMEFHAEPDPAKHVLAHVFKVIIDPYVGKLGVFRVHQGTVKRDSQLYVGDGTRPFRVAHLYLLQGKEYVETDALVPGDIGAVSKVEEIEFDAVLHDSHDEDHIRLRPLEFPCTDARPRRRDEEERRRTAAVRNPAQTGAGGSVFSHGTPSGNQRDGDPRAG